MRPNLYRLTGQTARGIVILPSQMQTMQKMLVSMAYAEPASHTQSPSLSEKEEENLVEKVQWRPEKMKSSTVQSRKMAGREEKRNRGQVQVAVQSLRQVQTGNAQSTVYRWYGMTMAGVCPAMGEARPAGTEMPESWQQVGQSC